MSQGALPLDFLPIDRQPNRDLATADGHDRHVPSEVRDFVAVGHEGVYEWVAEHLVGAGTRFLDLGCGTGYGSAVVTAVGATYDGVDSSTAAVEFARANYARAGVRFFVADLAASLPPAIAPQSYDVVFSSEVLEHVVDPYAFVDAMVGCVRDDGVCFVGTPNRLWSRQHMPRGELMARSHVMEFSPPALEGLLRTAFADVTLRFRMFPEEAIRSAVLPSSRRRLVRGALAFARGVVPAGLVGYARALDRRQPRDGWSSRDIAWLDADDPRVDPARCVGLAAVCRAPKR